MCWSSCKVRHSCQILILTYSMVQILLEKLNGLQLVKKFLAFHGTRMFITALTSLRHPSLSWASPIQSIYPHPTSRRSILILSTHVRLGLPCLSICSNSGSEERIIFWDPPSSRTLRSLKWWSHTKVSGQPIGPIFKGSEVQGSLTYLLNYLLTYSMV